MGTVSVINAASQTIKLRDFTINEEEMAKGDVILRLGESYRVEYKSKDCNDFSVLNMDAIIDGITYHVNLDRKHYFGGGDFHYPGDDSAVSFVLFGTDTEAKHIQLRLAYGQAGTERLLYSNDTKNLDRR